MTELVTLRLLPGDVREIYRHFVSRKASLKIKAYDAFADNDSERVALIEAEMNRIDAIHKTVRAAQDDESAGPAPMRSEHEHTRVELEISRGWAETYPELATDAVTDWLTKYAPTHDLSADYSRPGFVTYIGRKI